MLGVVHGRDVAEGGEEGGDLRVGALGRDPVHEEATTLELVVRAGSHDEGRVDRRRRTKDVGRSSRRLRPPGGHCAPRRNGQSEDRTRIEEETLKGKH